METGNAKFDSLLNLLKEANEKNSKVKNKINFQIEERNKTKAILNQFEECLKQQNEMLNKLFDEKLAIKNYRNDLIKKLHQLENSDDEECENVYDNQNDSFVQINFSNFDIRNYGHTNTYQDRLDNPKQVDYYEQSRTDMDKSIESINENRCQVNYDIEPIKINFESDEISDNCLNQSDNNESIKNDYFVPSQNNNRKFVTLKVNIKLPENETSIFKDEDFIKKYSPKLMFKLKNNMVEQINNNSVLYVCCDKGILLIYDYMIRKWRKLYTGSSKKILQYAKYESSHYLFCENEFVTSNELKIEVKGFNSNIISNLHILNQKNPICYISLENGDIWRYDLKNDKYDEIFCFHSKMKSCVNLKNKISLFLSENGKVFTTNYLYCEEIPELDGCVDILTSYGATVVCYFGNGVCKIYETTNKKLFELKISESIKFAKYSNSILAVLDEQNRLCLYKLLKDSFHFKKIHEIQIPTSKNISAMSEVNSKEIFITVNNKIYSIKYI